MTVTKIGGKSAKEHGEDTEKDREDAERSFLPDSVTIEAPKARIPSPR
ncbi:hypothetical protein L618_000200001660 [Rhodococcus rhodochrous J45]|uniref:Uncharacterized protein n=1 Tax=Rhodococcus rhodochrous J45 TaxID=935266 RepID=A0A562E510_RHORH|nr:hypothetical protein L618_000200001660 [Rhodococcus rhodochrous J45]